MPIYKSKNRIFATIMCLLLAACFPFAYRGHAAVSADEAEYCILDDFNDELSMLDYPEIPNDYSLSVVRLAESNDGKVVVYVYQPCAGRHNVIATSINVSTGPPGAQYDNYKLEILGSYKTLVKYSVAGLSVDSTDERNYRISSVYRAFNSSIDTLPDGAYNVNELAYPVGQDWTATTNPDGSISYAFTYTETISITDRYDGYIRYKNLNGSGFNDYIDRHYIAFSTDRDLDDVISADVYFGTYTVKTSSLSEILKFDPDGEPEQYETVHISRSGFTTVNSAFSPMDHSWRGIEYVDEFLEKETLRSDVRDNIANKQFVLSYLTTDFKQLYMGVPIGLLGMFTMYSKTFVSDVTMLRLNFLSDGKAYTMGVVDNKVTPDPYPDNWAVPDPNKSSFWNDIAGFFKRIGKFFSTSFNGNWWVWIIIAVAVFVVILLLPTLLPLLLNGLILLLKGLWWLISAPFKWIYRKIRKE